MLKQPSRIHVIGAGGHAKVAIRAAQAAGIEVVAAYDDDIKKHGTTLCGVPVKGPLSSILEADTLPTLIAIGCNESRLGIAEQLTLPWATVVHPAAYVDASVVLGVGVLVLAQAVVQVDTVIGDHSIVNNSVTIEHDCCLGVGVHVSSNACMAGGARVGNAALVGAGATLLPGVTVGIACTIGAGAVVISDVPDSTTAVGVPARILTS